MGEAIVTAIIASVSASIIFFIFQVVVAKINDKRKSSQVEDRSNKDALQAILMIMLEDRHDKFCERGWATLREKTLYDKMYNSYHNLGQNGVMTEAHKEVMKLPSSKAE